MRACDLFAHDNEIKFERRCQPTVGFTGAGAGTAKPFEGERLQRRKLLENAVDRASELQASIAQPKRMSAWHPHTSGAHFVGKLSLSIAL